jgi:hypothetical protein
VIIEHITGHAPSTCPWRAFSDPLVREVMGCEWASGDGNLSAVIGTDPPFQLAAALGIFERSMKATQADERKIKADEAEAKRRVKEAARKRG